MFYLPRQKTPPSKLTSEQKLSKETVLKFWYAIFEQILQKISLSSLKSVKLQKTCMAIGNDVNFLHATNATMSLSQSSEISKVFFWKVAHLDFNSAEIFVYLFTAIALPFKRLTSSQPVLSCSCEYLESHLSTWKFKSASKVKWTCAWCKLTIARSMGLILTTYQYQQTNVQFHKKINFFLK